jgi:ATP-dependent helicase/nuclease subunit A
MLNLSENQLKALDLERNLAITAGAGSGKTTVLVSRYLHILLQNPALSVKNILAITFTEKATAEMKERIFLEIEEKFRSTRSQQARLFDILNQLPEVQIFTIHAFCNHILKRYAVEAEIDPNYTILRDAEMEDLLSQVYREFLLSFEVQTHPNQQVIMSALREFPLAKLRDFFISFYQNRANLYQFVESGQLQAPDEFQSFWKDIFIKSHQSFMANLIDHPQFWNDLEKLLQLADGSTQMRSELQKHFELIHQPTADPFSKIQAAGQLLNALTTENGSAYSRPPGGKATWGGKGIILFKKLSTLASKWNSDFLPYEEETEAIYSRLHIGICTLFFELLRMSEIQKTKLNVLDYNDLQIMTLKLLHNKPEIREQLRRQYPFILVDEFQDTDSLQTDLIHLLTHDYLGNFDRNRLFIVGDPKQSIFGFRNADVTIFSEYLHKISQQGSYKIPFTMTDKKHPLSSSEEERQGIITLSHNFRSAHRLIHFYNQTFESIFTQNSEFDVPYQRLEPGRTDSPRQKSLVQLDLIIDQTADNIDSAAVQAQQIVRIIKEIVDNPDFQKLLSSKEQVNLENLSFGDIALLLRSRNHLQTFEQTFRDHHIPYQTFKGIGFFQKSEIRDIYHILRSVAHPEDNFSLVATLRSNYLGLTDVCLFYLSQTRGGTYWEKLLNLNGYLAGEKKLNDILFREFLGFLETEQQSLRISSEEKHTIRSFVSLCYNWHSLVWGGKFSRLLDDIIEKLNIRPILHLQADADQKLANLDKFIHYVAEYEQSTSSLLLDFLESLRKQISGEIREGEAIILAEEENKVKILTYHSAKGMEFPVVFLPLLEKKFHYNSHFLFDKDYGISFELELSKTKKSRKSFAYRYLECRDKKKIEAEEKRLFYVASTRARDFLFLSGMLPASGSRSPQNYLNWLLKSHGLDDLTAVSEKQNQFQSDLPGFKFNIHTVTDQSTSISASERLIASAKETIPVISPEDFRYSLVSGEQPNNQRFSVTQLMIFREDPERYYQHFYLSDFRSELAEEYADEPGGQAWGSLVHKMLEYFYLRNPQEDQTKIRQLLTQFPPEARQLNSYQSKLEKIISSVRESELAGEIDKNQAYSELSVNMRIAPYILQGIFDLLYKNPQGCWEVVDFKSNRIRLSEVTTFAKKYEFQIRAYALLLAGLYPEQTSYPVSLFFLEPHKIVRKEYNLLEIESTRVEISSLLEKSFRYEMTIFAP